MSFSAMTVSFGVNVRPWPKRARPLPVLLGLIGEHGPLVLPFDGGVDLAGGDGAPRTPHADRFRAGT
jgi:hypothetical protein